MTTDFSVNTKLPTPLTALLFTIFQLSLLLIPGLFSWHTSELFEFVKMHAFYTVTVFLMSLWLINAIQQKKLVIVKSRIDLPILLWLGSQLLATLHSVSLHTSIFGYYGRWHGGLLSSFAYAVLLWVFISTVPKKQLSIINLSWLGSIVIWTLYALPEHWGVSLSCGLMSAGTSWSVDCWQQDAQARIFGSFGQPNWLAAWLVASLPFVIMWTLTHKHHLSRLGGGLIIALATTGVIFSGSRSGLLSLIAGLVGSGVLVGWQVARRRLSLNVNWVCAVLLIVAAPILWQQLPTAIHHNSAPSPLPITSDLGGTDSGEIRKIVWQGAIAVWRRYPWLGSGVETFAYSYYQDRPASHNLVSEWDFLYNKAHNEFLNLAATTGSLGLITWLIVLVVPTWSGLSWLATTKQSEHRALVIGLLAGLWSAQVSHFFGFSTVAVTQVQYLILAELIMITTPLTVIQFSLPKHRLFSGVGLVVVGILTTWSLAQIVKTGRADIAFATSQRFQATNLSESLAYGLQASQLSPQEPIYAEQTAAVLADAAATLSVQGESTPAAELAAQATTYANWAIILNPNHLNFYLSQSKIMIVLAQLDQAYLNQAIAPLLTAVQLAPSYPKPYYQLALISQAVGQPEQAEQYFLQAIELKPDYQAALFSLAELYEQQGQLTLAQEWYHQLLSVNPNHAEALVKMSDLMQ